ncbi:4-hydroxy-tetrahydrodipicolinate reductase [Allohahella marinimesophila]
MTGIAILGVAGRMGRALVEAVQDSPDAELAGATVREGSQFLQADVGAIAGVGSTGIKAATTLDAGCDVIIDFTSVEALEANLELATRLARPIVIGTTGLSEAQKSLLSDTAREIPIVFAPNMSVGVNVLIDIVGRVASLLGDTYDVEIIETHHRFKKDAPSGTALRLGEAAADALGRSLSECAVYGREGHTGERTAREIGFETIRGGDVVGDHTVLFAGLGERVELTHKASSRLTFATGAVKAAVWLAGKPPGLYDMRDVLGLSADQNK